MNVSVCHRKPLANYIAIILSYVPRQRYEGYDLRGHSCGWSHLKRSTQHLRVTDGERDEKCLQLAASIEYEKLNEELKHKFGS